MTNDDILKIQLDFLKTEMSILDGKMKGVVDRLWQLRALCGTLWAGLVAIGLGAGTGDSAAIPEVLWLSAAVPVWFAWIDSSYQRWYRRFRMREEAITRFLNNRSMQPEPDPLEGFEKSISSQRISFPIFDITGQLTYRNDFAYLWWGSRWSSLFDTTPLFTFGGLTLASLVLCFLRPGALPKSAAIITGACIFGGLYTIGLIRYALMKRRAAQLVVPADSASLRR